MSVSEHIIPARFFNILKTATSTFICGLLWKVFNQFKRELVERFKHIQAPIATLNKQLVTHINRTKKITFHTY